MRIQDLDAAAEHFRPLVTPQSKPHVQYDALSNARIWSDEIPQVSPSLWWCIRPVWRYRTCLIATLPLEYEEWWSRAKALFPQWVGFTPDRCRPDPELQTIYERGCAELERDLSDEESRLGWDN